MKKDKVYYANAIVKMTTCYDFMTLLTNTKRYLKKLYKWIRSVING